MGSKGVRNAISKRRPRQNIISMILKNAKNKNKQGSSSTESTAASSRSSDAHHQQNHSSTSATAGGATSSRHHQSSNRSQGLIKSAVELTRRSKKITSSSSRSQSSASHSMGRSSSRSAKRGGKASRNPTFLKGQRAFYRSAKGIAKVTVVGIHHDAKLEPYYTIKLRDGKEKQTDGKHLTPIQPTEKDKGGADGDKARHRSTSRGKKEHQGDDTQERGGIAVETVTDEESSSEGDEEVAPIDYGDDDAEEADLRQTGGSKDDDNEDDNSSASSFIEEETLKKQWAAGQDAYYRAPNGIHKVHILSLHNERYTISFPDGSQQENIRSGQLATLMDLTSKELSGLMKERNKRQLNDNTVSSGLSVKGGGGGGTRSHSKHWQPKSKSSSGTMEDNITTDTDVVVDEGYEAGEGGSASPGAVEQRQSVEATAPPSPVTSPPVAGAGAATALVIAPPVLMVQAKTEEGTSISVPKYEVGRTLYYKNALTGIQGCTVLTVYLDDLLLPYYDVKLEDGREKQTDNAHLMLTLEGEEEGEGKKDAGEEEGGQEEEVMQLQASLEQAQETEEVSQELEKHQSEDEHHHTEDPAPKKISKKHHSDAESGQLVPVAASKFTPGDEVLYNSSQGEHVRAVVVKLRRDKKNRPYYVIRLSKGKEKQVYGHRLQPLVGKEDDHDDAPKRRRSMSRGPIEAKENKTSEQLKRSVRGRSASKKVSKRDSHDPESMSNSSRRSRASKERHAAAREESLVPSRHRGGREESVASSRDGRQRPRPDQSVASSRSGRQRPRGREESLVSSRSGRHRDESLASARDGHRSAREESVTRDSSRRHPSSATEKRSQRSRSQSISRTSSHISSTPQTSESRRQRSHSKAASEDGLRASLTSSGSHQFSMSHHHSTISNSAPRSARSSRRSSVTSVSASSKVADESTATPGRSMSRMKSFRKSLSRTRK